MTKRELAYKILNDLGFYTNEEGIDLNIEFIPTFGIEEERQIDVYLGKIDKKLIEFDEYERLHKELIRLLFIDAFLENYSVDTVKISHDNHIIYDLKKKESKERTFFDGVGKKALMEYLIREYPGYIRNLAVKINTLLGEVYLESLSSKTKKPLYKSNIFKDSFYDGDIVESINMINSFDLETYYKTKDKEGRQWLRDKSDIANYIITPMQSIGISEKGTSIHANLMLRINGCIFDKDELNNYERNVNFIEESHDTNSIIYRMFDIEKRPHISETKPEYLNSYQRKERIKFFEKICEIKKGRSDEEKILYFNTFFSSIVDDAFVQRLKEEDVKVDNSIHNDFEVSLEERSIGLGINPYIGIINRSKKLMNMIIKENINLYDNNIIYESEITDIDRTTLINIVKKKSEKFNLDMFFRNKDTVRATGIITEDTSLLLENFVALYNGPSWTEHVRTANALYLALYDEELENESVWMDEITKDGNILLQFISFDYSFIWLPDTISDFQMQQLHILNDNIKSAYEKDKEFYEEYPMEFYTTIGEDTIYVTNNIDEIIETLARKLN